MSFFSGKKLLLLGIIVVLLTAIPATVYILQQQQQTQSQATKATVLSFTPATKPNVKVGDTFDLDIYMNPGSNTVSSVKINITYDAAKLSTTGAGLVQITSVFPVVVRGPLYTAGTATLHVSTGIDPTVNDLTGDTPIKIGTVTFQAKADTAATTTAVSLANSVVTSQTDPEANVLSSAQPAAITIAAAAVSPTATPTPTPPAATLTPTPPAATATPTGTQSALANQAPVCTALNVDRTTSGTAPFAITFTAIGNDPDGTINKVTFNFGDGPVQDVTTAGGIGTKTVSSQVAHTYNNAGTFTASAILTDERGATSTPTGCTQTIVVGGGSTGGVAGGAETPSAATATPIPTATTIPSATPDVKATPLGPGNTVLGVGVVGTMLSILGAVFFLML